MPLPVDLNALRAWQREAIEKYRITNSRDFLITATPGSGKTTCALAIASKLIHVGAIKQIVVVVPTDHLRTQWADSAIEREVFLDPSLSNAHSVASDDYIGYVVTYAQIAANPALHRKRVSSKPTLVIFDEIHHAGDGLSWGTAVRHAFEGATRRLCLTGTPFRTSTNSEIPFVRYDSQSDGSKINHSDYTYGYGEALKDGVVRPITFAAYDSESTWRDSAGDVYSSTLSDVPSKEIERQALRTALAPDGEWIPHVFRAAHERLIQVRAAGMSDAAGMVLASDQETAKEYAKIMRRISKGPVALVVSDDNSADKKIDAFGRGEGMWLVAVRMVSEGVDIPRLAVGVWATNYRTPLFFAQAVGRYIRARNRSEVATVFLPSIKPILALAAEMEQQRQHVIGPKSAEDLIEELEKEIAAANKEENAPSAHVSMSSSATFDHVLFNGQALDGITNLTEEDSRYVGIPGLLDPSQIASLLRTRDTEMRIMNKALEGSGTVETAERINLHHQIAESRKNINRMVSRIALTRAVGHAHVHKLTQKAVPGPPSSVATLAILEQREEWLHKNV